MHNVHSNFVKHGSSELKVCKCPDHNSKKSPDHFSYLFILSSPHAKIYVSPTGAVQMFSNIRSMLFHTYKYPFFLVKLCYYIILIYIDI